MRIVFLILMISSLAISCGSSKDYQESNIALKDSLEEKNRTNISLAIRIRQKPGVSFRQGVPVINKYEGDLYTKGGSNFEPLYILNDFIVGNSFRQINELVSNENVKEIEILSSADASFYGARAANGVIKIITY